MINNRKKTKSRSKTNLFIIFALLFTFAILSITIASLSPDNSLLSSIGRVTKTLKGSPAESNNTPPQQGNETITNNRYLTIEEWGVRVKIPNDMDVKYYKISDTFYGFSTKQVEDLGGKGDNICTEPNDRNISAPRLGYLGRTTEPFWNTAENPPLSGKPINNYYYYYQGPQSYCSNENIAVQNQDSSLIKTMLESLGPV